MTIEKIDEKTLESYIRTCPHLLVNFYVPTLLGSDQVPVLKKLQKQYKNTIKIVIINAAKCRYWPQKLKINKIPVVLFFKNGINIAVRRKGSKQKFGSQVVGFKSYKELKELCDVVFF